MRVWAQCQVNSVGHCTPRFLIDRKATGLFSVYRYTYSTCDILGFETLLHFRDLLSKTHYVYNNQNIENIVKNIAAYLRITTFYISPFRRINFAVALSEMYILIWAIYNVI